jgi:hypothetical protein
MAAAGSQVRLRDTRTASRRGARCARVRLLPPLVADYECADGVSPLSRHMSSHKPILRTSAFTAAFFGSLVSVTLMLRACRFNGSGLALAFIAVWILSPTIALGFADVVAKRWAIFGRATVYCLMLVVASGSVITYGIDVLVPLSPRAGFPYALVPAVSWLLITTVLVVAALTGHARAKSRVA